MDLVDQLIKYFQRRCLYERTVMLRVMGLLLLISAAGFIEAETIKNQVIPVTTSQNLSPLIPVGGQVEAKKSVMLSAQLPGRVVYISGQEGDFFEKGSVLLSMDETELRARRREAESQWHSANAALSNAMVQRNQVLVSPGSTLNTPGGMALPGLFDEVFSGPMSSMMGKRKMRGERGASVYASGTQVSQASHALEQIHASIEQIDTRLRDSRSIAPFDGVITEKYVEEGDTVQPGQSLLGFEDTSQLQIVADIPVRLAHVLREDDQLLARIDANNIMTGVLVENVFPKADPAQHTVKVKFDLPQTIQTATGAYAEVFLPDPGFNSKAPVIVVPQTVITQRGGLPVIFVVDETRTAILRLVRPGQDLNNGRQVVDYGLTPTDLVVDNPASWLVSGTKLESSNISAKSDADSADMANKVK